MAILMMKPITVRLVPIIFQLGVLLHITHFLKLFSLQRKRKKKKITSDLPT